MVMPILQPGVDVRLLHLHLINQGMQLYFKRKFSHPAFLKLSIFFIRGSGQAEIHLFQPVILR